MLIYNIEVIIGKSQDLCQDSCLMGEARFSELAVCCLND